MASNHHSFEDFATAVAWEAGKLLVMERVKVAPPKAMEMRIKVKYTSVYHTELYFCRRLLKVEKFLRSQSIWVESVDLKPKRFDEAKEKTETSTSAEVQKLLIGRIADSTTNEHYNFKLDVDM